MVLNGSAFTELRNGREQTTDGLWTHRGRLFVKAQGGDVLDVGGPDDSYIGTGRRITVTDNVVPRISSAGWLDAHIALNQQTPSEPRIGFHEMGSSALSLYKEQGSNKYLRVRGNDGTDYALAGAPGSGSKVVAEFNGSMSWTTPSAGVWYETPLQVSGTFTGARHRIEYSVAVTGSVDGGAYHCGIGYDGALYWHVSSFTAAAANGYGTFSGTIYGALSGPHRVSVFFHASQGSMSFYNITSTLYVTEQVI